MPEPISTTIAAGIASSLAADATKWIVSEAQNTKFAHEIRRRLGSGETNPKTERVLERSIQDASRGLRHLKDQTVQEFFDVSENRDIVKRWIWDPDRASAEIDDLDLSTAGTRKEYSNLQHFVEELPKAIDRNTEEVFDEETRLIIWRVVDAFERIEERIEEISPPSDPAPLSEVPPDPLSSQPPVGRQDELNWLRGTEGDRLLVGQPGSGKTLLLYHLTEDGALFAVSDDRSQLGPDLQEKKPEVVIVDDAASKLELLRNLRQLRKEVETEFDIVASCWPGATSDLKTTLDIGRSQVRKLPALTRDEVVEVVRLTGLEGPAQLIREIVDQAYGRPGLAVTLTRLCLDGDVREVVLGDRIAETILSTFERITGDEVREVLGILALGGNKGLEVESVSRLTGMSRVYVNRMLEQLAVGGVITEVQIPGPIMKSTDKKQGVAVQPPALRHALIRDVFFEGPCALDYQEVVREAPSKYNTIRALIVTRAKGASVSRDFLQERIERIDRRNLWKHYAAAGKEEAEWILSEHPDRTAVVAEEALSSAPSATLKMLLKQSVDDNRPLPRTSEHPLRKVKEWVLSGRPGTELAIDRRKTLFKLAQRWLSNGNDRLTGVKAMRYALAPQYKDSALDPGSGHSLTLQHGTLTEKGIEEIAPFWTELWEEINEEELEEWPPILELLHDWWHPHIHWKKIPDDLRNTIREYAEEQLNVAVEKASPHPGVLRRLSRLASEADVEIDTTHFEKFDVLYPEQNPDTPTDYRDRHAEQIEELAVQWKNLNPDEVAQKVYRVWRQSEVAGLHMKSTRLICRALARQVESPLSWNRAFKDAGLPSRLCRPFLEAATHTNHGEHDSQVLRQIERQIRESPERCGPSLEIALRESSPGDNLYELALQNLEDHVGVVEPLIFRDELDPDKICDLLDHGNDQIAETVAEALWRSGQSSSSLLEAIPDEVHESWREAVIHRVGDAAWLKRAVEEDPQLAQEWAIVRIREGNPIQFLNFSVHNTETAAVEALDREGRSALLTELIELNEETRRKGVRWAQTIVGDSLELYQEVLEEEVEEKLHLAPLLGKPDEIWMEKAELALSAGYSPEKIAEAALDAKEATPTGFVADESLSDEWQDWADSFKFLTTDDPDMQKVLDHGAHCAEQLAGQAAAQEK